MKQLLPIVTLFVLANIAVAQQPDDKAALAPFINEATVAVERYDLAQIDMQATRKWVLQAARAAQNHPRQAQYLAYLENSADIPRLIQLYDQLKAAGVTRVYLVGTTAILNDPPGFLLIPLDPKSDAAKISSALVVPGAAEKMLPKDLDVLQLENAIIVAPRVAFPGLKTMRPAERPDLLAALQSAGDAPIVGALALNPAVSMIFEQTMPTIPFINRPTSDITHNFRFGTLAATPGENPSMNITIHATNADGAKVLNSVIADVAKFAASKEQRGQTPPIPTPTLDNDTLKVDLIGASLAPAVLGMIDARLKAQMVDAITRIRVIIQICYNHKFNVEKGDKSWPTDLDVLVKSGELKPESLKNPRFADQNPGFTYIRPAENLGEGKAPTTVVLYENAPQGTPQIAVGFVDGHAELMKSEHLQKLLEQSKPTAAAP